jgi:mannose-1-phosphate guanylyltransferase
MKKIQDFGGFFDETTIVLCGDAVIDLDLKSALYEHRRKGAMATVITREVDYEKVSSYGVVVCNDSGRVIEFQEKPRVDQAKSNRVSTGIYIFEPEVLSLIPRGQTFRYWLNATLHFMHRTESSAGSISVASAITGKFSKASLREKLPA